MNINGMLGQSQLFADSTGEMQGKVTTKKLRKMLERQGYCCALSGLPLEPQLASCDHAMPASRGGDNAMENIMILHRVVNASKWSMTPEEFIGMCYTIIANNEGVYDYADCVDQFRKFATTLHKRGES